MIGLFLTMAISTWGAAQQSSDLAKACQGKSGTWVEKYGECEGVDEQWCTTSGGKFNECASACRHNPDPAAMCTMQCIPVCSFSVKGAEADAGSRALINQAWSIVEAGAASKSTEERVATLRVLQLIPGDPKAIGLAEQGLKDRESEVRGAAALSLGEMKSKSAIPSLVAAAKSDTEGAVVMATAKSLIELGDEKGYSVYYAVLTGQRKSGDGLIGDQEKELNEMLRNPKELETMAFEQGIGFVPFGGIGFQAYQTIHASESKAPIVKATSIKILATDPDARTGRALVAATADKEWVVRAAAYDALARRGDSSLLPDLASGLKDDKDEVRLTAAAAVIHLSTISTKAAK
jgi:HEAT repeat protein